MWFQKDGFGPQNIPVDILWVSKISLQITPKLFATHTHTKQHVAKQGFVQRSPILSPTTSNPCHVLPTKRKNKKSFRFLAGL